MARFTNQAQLAYRNRITTSNIAVGEILEVLSAAKHAVVETYESYDVITYVVSLVNSGTTALTGLVLTDNLGAYTFNEASLFPLQYVANSLKYYVNGVLQTSPVIASQEPLQIENLKLQNEEVESVRWMDYQECREKLKKEEIKSCIRLDEFEMIGKALGCE